MPGITIIIVASVVAFFIVGIPLIVRKIRFPVDVTYAPINIDEMEGLDRAFFQEKGSKLEALGFKRAMDMSISGLIGTNNNRMFSDGKGNIALLSELSVEHGQSKKHFEFNTPFAGGGELNTTPTAESGQFLAKLPGKIIQRFPDLEDVGELYQKHLSRLDEETKNGKIPEKFDLKHFEEAFKSGWKKEMDYQVQMGLLRVDYTGKWYVAQPKLAVRGVLNYLNPFKADFTPRRFLIGFIPSILIVVAASYLNLNDQHPLRFLSDPFGPQLAAGIFLGLCYFVAGIILGFVFNKNTFIWTVLLTLPPLLIFRSSTAYPFSMFFACYISASTLSDFRYYGGFKGHGVEKAKSTLTTGLVLLGILYFFRYGVQYFMGNR